MKKPVSKKGVAQQLETSTGKNQVTDNPEAVVPDAGLTVRKSSM